MRENEGSAFALVDIGHSPALDFQELLSSERLCAIGHCFSPYGAFGISVMSLICAIGPSDPRTLHPSFVCPCVRLFLFLPLCVKLRDRRADGESPGKHKKLLKFFDTTYRCCASSAGAPALNILPA